MFFELSQEASLHIVGERTRPYGVPELLTVREEAVA